MKLRNLFFSIVLAFVTVNAHAQYVTNFYLTDLDNETLKETAQKNISTLLTEFNMAQADGRALNLGGIQISERAQADLNKLWAESPFRCGDTEMIERCLLMHDKSYQVRNIQIFMRGAEDEEEYHEAVIGFNAQGAISDFHLAIDNNLYLHEGESPFLRFNGRTFDVKAFELYKTLTGQDKNSTLMGC